MLENTMNLKQKFSSHLKLLLKRSYATQKELADFNPAILSQNKVSKFCLGKQLPNLNQMLSIVEFFKLRIRPLYINFENVLGLDQEFNNELKRQIKFEEAHFLPYDVYLSFVNNEWLVKTFIRYNDIYPHGEDSLYNEFEILKIDLEENKFVGKNISDEKDIRDFYFKDYNNIWF